MKNYNFSISLSADCARDNLRSLSSLDKMDCWNAKGNPLSSVHGDIWTLGFLLRQLLSLKFQGTYDATICRQYAGSD